MRDQDIVNAMALEKICKQILQMMRDEGCDTFYGEVSSFCENKKTKLMFLTWMICL